MRWYKYNSWLDTSLSRRAFLRDGLALIYGSRGILRPSWWPSRDMEVSRIRNNLVTKPKHKQLQGTYSKTYEVHYKELQSVQVVQKKALLLLQSK